VAESVTFVGDPRHQLLGLLEVLALGVAHADDVLSSVDESAQPIPDGDRLPLQRQFLLVFEDVVELGSVLATWFR
jgi:hypothetical protein